MKLTLEQLNELKARLPKPTRHGEMMKAAMPDLMPPPTPAMLAGKCEPIGPAVPSVLCEAVTYDSPERGYHLRWMVHCEPVV